MPAPALAHPKQDEQAPFEHFESDIKPAALLEAPRAADMSLLRRSSIAYRLLRAHLPALAAGHAGKLVYLGLLFRNRYRPRWTNL